jgi:hypothetical protein
MVHDYMHKADTSSDKDNSYGVGSMYVDDDEWNELNDVYEFEDD